MPGDDMKDQTVGMGELGTRELGTNELGTRAIEQDSWDRTSRQEKQDGQNSQRRQSG
jgi:hypothetical protein